MQIGKKLLAAAMVLTGVMASGAATAALSQGSVGTTSVGNLDIQVVIPKLIVVNGLSNIDLGTFDGVTAASGNSNACVRTNGSGTYSVAVSSANGSFILKSGANSIAYTVSWGGTAAAYGSGPAAAVPEATTLAGACGATATNKINVGATVAAMSVVPAGTYTDTLIVTVSPN